MSHPPAELRARIGKLLLEPGPRLRDESKRATAVLFAGCLLALIIVFASYDAFLVANRVGYSPPWPAYLLMLAAYGLLRAGYYTVAASLTLAMLPGVAFALVVTGNAPVPVSTLTFPVLSILLATLLLDARGTALVTLGSVVLIVLTAVIDGPHQLGFATIVGPLVTVAVGGAIGVLSIVHRSRLDHDRRRVLESTAVELEHRVAARTAELAASVEELESFSYSVSHDLRAPIRAIEGFAAIVTEDHGERLGPEGQELVDVIRTSAVRMSVMVDSLLQLSRMARTSIHRRDVDLAIMAREIIRALRLTDEHRRVAFECPDTLIVRADPVLARTVLDNLIGNAWKFTAHAAEPRIQLARVDRDGHDWCVVRDNGAGFDMHHAAQLFRPFERLHSPDEFPGTGVGLATVHRVVTRHHGAIFAESVGGEGASFYFHFGSDDATGSYHG